MGNDRKYEKAADALGAWIAGQGHRLIYGGSKIGLMGVLASAAIRNGGEVIGIEPEFFVRRFLQLDGLKELIETKDMRERKKKLMDMADVLIAFPGGMGTMEEITEAMTSVKLGLLEPGPAGSRWKKCIMYNLDGFYDPVRELYDRMEQEGFITAEDRTILAFVPDLPSLAAELAKTYCRRNQ